MVRDLAHHAVDDELIITELRARATAEARQTIGARSASVAAARALRSHRHRRVARIAIENGECTGWTKRVLLRVLTQFAGGLPAINQI